MSDIVGKTRDDANQSQEITLTNEQRMRYGRQIVIPEIGVLGQKKLMTARVLIAGVGGLGSPVAYYLCAAGVGTICIVDDDVVDLSNLNRQTLHFTDDIGKPKVVSAKKKLDALNPECNVITLQERLTEPNIKGIITGFDIVIDCTDNFDTRFLINDCCVLTQKPLIYGAVSGLYGQAATIIPKESACYRCMFSEPPPPNVTPNPAQMGILGVLPGIIGLIQATEALKYFLGTTGLLTGKMLTYNAQTMDFGEINMCRNPKCPACGDSPSIFSSAV